MRGLSRGHTAWCMSSALCVGCVVGGTKACGVNVRKRILFFRAGVFSSSQDNQVEEIVGFGLVDSRCFGLADPQRTLIAFVPCG